MLNAISDFFQRTLAQPEQRENHTLTLELATAALLCEIVRADYNTTDEELATLRTMLLTRYRLSESAAEELMTMAEAQVEDAVDHYQFVSLIKDHYSYDQRRELVSQMWQLAWADGNVDPLEEHRIRRLADLLYVSHSDFIRTKLQVEERHNPDV
ncbi:TerB family tellurite resistance protein [Halomonas sp. MC140]|uniref:tellurite resistance TerB family protein n=1 Tax=Vreelandella profundi TaxID=2852117 RepID=UPI001F381DBB|nr:MULTISPECIES: TerB family tellurite resistance protein [Halomonas]MDN7131494.1 TerB family tellurite resistance protein [Halomonas sp. MC140]